MRNSRLLLTFASLTCIAVGGLVACGGDDDTNGGTVTPGVDSGGTSGQTSSSSSSSSSGSTSGGPQDSGPAKPTAAASGSSVYLGQTVSLDGSGSTGDGATYEWTVTAPAGSAITNASIQNATASKASFVPDKLGEYTLTLTVKNAGGSATATVKIQAVDAPVFFFAQDSNPGSTKHDRGTLRVANVFSADGDGGAEVACFEQDAGATAINDTMSSKTGYGGEIWSDWWEAPAGQPSRAVFYWRTEEGGKHAGRLFAVTSAGSCATPPVSIDSVADAENIDAVFELPRFSPNGQRVLYTKQDVPNHVRITTVAFDGTAAHSIADRQVASDGGSDPDGGRFNGAGWVGPGPRPSWIDDTNVAWLTKDDDTHWQIIKAADAANAVPSVLMTCTGSLPNDFAVLSNGDVLVSQFVADADAKASAQNLLVYKPDADKKCSAPRNISGVISTNGGSSAVGFSLSPDRSKVAYVQYDDGTGATRIAIAPVDGSSAPVFVGNGLAYYQSPRWIAGGTQLTWGANSGSIDGGVGDGGSGTTIAIAASPVNSDAGGHAIVASTDQRTYTAVSASTLHCGMGYGFGSAMSGVGFLGLLGLGITRRRKKSS